MMIDWTHFTPLPSLLGGMLIGIGVAILLIFNGRIAGVSGIIGGLGKSGDRMWRAMFLFGLLASPMIWQQFHALPAITISSNKSLLIIAGLLVGIGTRIGSGCTSGHGVCGLSRWSKRSLVATVTFMTLGFVSTYFVRHLL